MKIFNYSIKLGLLMLFLCGMTFSAVAQAPQSFSYQVVARDAAGTMLVNQNVGFQFDIWRTDPSTGTMVYRETHNVTTDQFGIAHLNVGSGTVVSGTFSTIDWSNGPYYIKVAMDASGGTTYLDMGSSQLLSVPYALHSGTSDLSNTGVTAGSYGSATNVSTFDVDAKGRLTLAGNTPIAIDASQLTSGILSVPRGGTGIGSYTLGNYLRASGATSLEQRTPAQVLADIGAGNVSGTGSNTQVTYWTGANSVSGSDDFTWNGTQLNITPSGVVPSFNTLIRGGNTTMTGNHNIAIGERALLSNTTGQMNISIGVGSLDLNETGESNIALGYSALNQNAGSNNLGFGTRNLSFMGAGNNNIALGYETGQYYGTGFNVVTQTNNSIFIGYDARPEGNIQTNQIVLGHQGRGLGSNTARIGNSSITHTHLDGSVSIGSTTTPTQSLHVTGGARITDLNSGVNGAIVTSNSTGVLGFTNFSGQVTDVLRGDGTFGAASGGGGWSLTGNSGTVDGTNFIGTTDNIPFNIRVNNEKAGRISSAGHAIYGYQAGNNTSSDITAMGYQALRENTSGYRNLAMGYQALLNNTTGYDNLAIGTYAMQTNVANRISIAIGNSAMRYADSRATGQDAHNIAIGDNALRGSTTAVNNTGQYNVAIGSSSMMNNTSGLYNVGIGSFALYSNTDGESNTAIGYWAMAYNTTGDNNTAFGSSSLRNNTSGRMNVAIGNSALYSNTTGVSNTAFGYWTMALNTTGYNNTAFGDGAMVSNTTGINNSAVGYGALYNNLGSGNTAMGFEAGRRIVSGVNMTEANNSIFLGYDARPNANTNTNQIVIGYEGRGLGSNTTRIGNSFTTHTHLDGSVSIGATDAPGSRLVVTGSGTTSATAAFNVMNNTPSSLFYVRDDGYIGMGTTTPSQRLHVTGGARITDLNSGVNGAIVTSNSTGVLGFTNFSGQVTDVLRGDGTFGAASGGGGWSLTGNSGTVDGTNFIGTTDNIPFNIRVNNEKAGRISSGGHTIYGYQAGNANTSADITAMGYQALKENTSGDRNLAMGYQALGNNTAGYNNLAIGYQAMQTNVANRTSIAIGNYAMWKADDRATGRDAHNIAIGYFALRGSITPSDNTGRWNTAIGYTAMRDNTSGYHNLGIGYLALYNNTTGYNNTSIGNYTTTYNTTGSNNVAIGYGAGQRYGTGFDAVTQTNNSIFLGYDARPNANTNTNQIVIGYEGRGLGSNTTRIGNSSTTHTHLDGNVSIGSTTAPSVKLHINGPMSRNAPKIVTTQTYTVTDDDNWIILTYGSGNNTITLPSASAWTGRELMFLSRVSRTINSASNNVVGITGTTSSQILPWNQGANCTLVSDGTNWVIVQYSSEK